MLTLLAVIAWLLYLDDIMETPYSKRGRRRRRHRR